MPEGGGILVPREDEDALARAICRLSASATEREAMGQHAQRHVSERFSSDRLVRDIDHLYRELLGLGVPGRSEAPVETPGSRLPS